MAVVKNCPKKIVWKEKSTVRIKITTGKKKKSILKKLY